jgi:hypothetical protein
LPLRIRLLNKLYHRLRLLPKQRCRPILPIRGTLCELNYNAYVWEATSPIGKSYIVKGNRHQFCRDNNIGSSLDPKKPHLRGFWEFTKLCKVKDFTN